MVEGCFWGNLVTRSAGICLPCSQYEVQENGKGELANIMLSAKLSLVILHAHIANLFSEVILLLLVLTSLVIFASYHSLT